MYTITAFLSPFNSDYFHLGFIGMACLYMLIVAVASVAMVVRGWSVAGMVRRRLWIFLLVAFLVSLVPVSSYLVTGLNVDLVKSHFLYTATAFFLAMVAIGLLGFGRPGKMRPRAGAVALLLMLPLYFWGLQTNNRYWEDAAAAESVILEGIVRIMPEPPPNARIYLVLEEETKPARIYWCAPMLQPAIRSGYKRYDIRVRQGERFHKIEDLGETTDGYLFIYIGKTNQLRLDHTPVP